MLLSVACIQVSCGHWKECQHGCDTSATPSPALTLHRRCEPSWEEVSQHHITSFLNNSQSVCDSAPIQVVLGAGCECPHVSHIQVGGWGGVLDVSVPMFHTFRLGAGSLHRVTRFSDELRLVWHIPVVDWNSLHFKEITVCVCTI